jgi:hypothetical protein
MYVYSIDYIRIHIHLYTHIAGVYGVELKDPNTVLYTYIYISIHMNISCICILYTCYMHIICTYTRLYTYIAGVYGVELKDTNAVLYTYIYVYKHIYTYVYIYIYTHIFIYMYTYVYVSIHIYMKILNISMYLFIYLHKYIYTHIYIYVSIFIYTFTYVYSRCSWGGIKRCKCRIIIIRLLSR